MTTLFSHLEARTARDNAIHGRRAGWILPTGRYSKSAQVSNHARPLAVWRSELYRGDG